MELFIPSILPAHMDAFKPRIFMMVSQISNYYCSPGPARHIFFVPSHYILMIEVKTIYINDLAPISDNKSDNKSSSDINPIVDEEQLTMEEVARQELLDDEIEGNKQEEDEIEGNKQEEDEDKDMDHEIGDVKNQPSSSSSKGAPTADVKGESESSVKNQSNPPTRKKGIDALKTPCFAMKPIGILASHDKIAKFEKFINQSKHFAWGLKYYLVERLNMKKAGPYTVVPSSAVVEPSVELPVVTTLIDLTIEVIVLFGGGINKLFDIKRDQTIIDKHNVHNPLESKQKVFDSCSDSIKAAITIDNVPMFSIVTRKKISSQLGYGEVCIRNNKLYRSFGYKDDIKQYQLISISWNDLLENGVVYKMKKQEVNASVCEWVERSEIKRINKKFSIHKKFKSKLHHTYTMPEYRNIKDLTKATNDPLVLPVYMLGRIETQILSNIQGQCNSLLFGLVKTSRINMEMDLKVVTIPSSGHSDGIAQRGGIVILNNNSKAGDEFVKLPVTDFICDYDEVQTILETKRKEGANPPRVFMQLGLAFNSLSNFPQYGLIELIGLRTNHDRKEFVSCLRKNPSNHAHIQRTCHFKQFGNAFQVIFHRERENISIPEVKNPYKITH